MFGKLKKRLEEPLFASMAMGISIALGLAFAVVTVVLIIASFLNAWWFLAFIPCSALAGACFGIAYCLLEEH